MPTSLFTRFLAWLVVLGHAFVLFTPYDGIYEGLGDSWILLIPLWIICAISVVRDAPPLNDLAFHRTLPPGAGIAFWRTVRVPLAMLCGIAVVLLWYVRHFNFSAGSFGTGLALLVLPALGFISACAVAASLASDRGFGKVRGWMTVFVPPFVSAGMIWWLRRDLPPVFVGSNLLRITAVIVLVTVVVYPLLWCLVAIGRRKVLAVAIAMTIGFGLPWIYGYYQPEPKKADERWKPEDSDTSSLISRRLPLEPGHADRNLLEPKELKAGELATFMVTVGVALDRKDVVVDGSSWMVQQKVDPKGHHVIPADGADRFHFLAGRFRDGAPAMGYHAVLAAVGGLLPEGVRLENWDASLDEVQVEMYPPLISTQAGIQGAAKKSWEEIEPLNWFATGFVMKIPKPVIFDLARGGSAPDGDLGSVEVEPLEEQGGGFVVKVEHFFDEGWSLDGARRESRINWPGSAPYLVIVDEAKGKAWLLNGSGEPSYARVFLGSRRKLHFEANALPAMTPESKERVRRLPQCKLYVFWPQEVRRFACVMPVPVGGQ